MSMDDSMSSSSRSDPIMEKAHLSSLPLPSVSTGTLSSVQAACDDLGKCEDPVRILHRLKALHKALVRSPVDAYDPSDTFLAIQGVTQRFLPPEQPGNATLPSSGGLSDNLGSDQVVDIVHGLLHSLAMPGQRGNGLKKLSTTVL